MNSDKPSNPGEELEIKITALLMGELSSDEASALREQLAGNAELQSLHTRLTNAFDLLRAAVPLDDKIEQITPARLSNERRERLLRRFKATAAPHPAIVPITKKRWTWLAPLSWAAAFVIAIGILSTMMMVPAAKMSRSSGISNPIESESYAGERITSYSAIRPEDAAPAPEAQAPPPPSATSALAAVQPPTRALAANAVDESRLAPDNSSDSPRGMPYVRGRGIEETGKNSFDEAALGQLSTSVAKAKPAPPQMAPQLPGGSVPLYSSTRSGAQSGATPAEVPPSAGDQATRALVMADDESKTLNFATGTEGTFWDKPATPGLAANGPVANGGGVTGSGSASNRVRPLTAKAEGLIQEKEKLAVELAEAKAPMESLKRESDLKSTLGEATKSMDQLKMAIPGDVNLGSVPILGRVFRRDAAETAGQGEVPAGDKKDATGSFAGRAGGGIRESQERQLSRENIAKADTALDPAKPASATGAVAGASVDSLSAARDKQVEDVVQLEIADAGTRGYAGKAIIGGLPMQRTQSEASVEKLAELADGDQLSRADNFEVGAKLAPADPQAQTSLGLKDTSGNQNAAVEVPNVFFGAESKPALPPADVDNDFSTLDGIAIAGAAKRESKRRFSLEADRFADTRRSESVINGSEVLNWAESAQKVDDKPEAEIVANPVEQDWYFKQDGTLAKLSKGKGVDVNGPAQQTAKLALKPAPEQPIILSKEIDAPVAATKSAPPVPQPEIATSANAFSTFSLNVTDVAFKLAAASLEQNKMPDPAAIRSEEFINAFDYRDPEPVGDAPLAFASERSRYPFAQNRDLLRLSIKTAAVGRQAGRPLNLVLLVDNSGSMERADRVQILRESLRVLAAQLQPTDKLSIITFARTPHLWVDGVPGNGAVEATQRVGEITPLGGTNLSAALDLAYETARKHYQVANVNRVVLLTDGAANLGDVNPSALKQKVEDQRKQGIALDCFGVGWEGYNDDLLEQLSRNGDGRYGFINSPEAATTEFAGQLAGALRVAASDVKVQVEFNPKRVTAYRQIGYAKHQLTKEQFRDNTVDAAEIGAAESGNALYAVEVNPRGEGDLATVRARFKVPGTSDYREHEWTIPFSPNVPALEEASPTMRLAATASAFSEWLAGSPYASEITSDKLLGIINGVPQTFSSDPRPQKLEWMIRQAKSISGR
jgi:Mg-chelatase subunit ChlD